MPPDLKGIVDRVDRHFPQLLRQNTGSSCHEFLSRVIHEPEARAVRLGFLTKPSPGSPSPKGFTLPDEPPWHGQKFALDVVAFPDGNRVDVISGSDNHPIPAGTSWNVVAPEFWRSSDVYFDAVGHGWPVFESGTAGGGEVKPTVLGRGMFWLLRALMDRWPEFEANWQFIVREERPKVIRVFADCEGERHALDGVDPWRDAGPDGRDPRWADAMAEMFNRLGTHNMQVWLTLLGGDGHYHTFDQQRRFNDQVVQAIEGNDAWELVFGIGCVNEHVVNGFDDAAVRRIGDDLATKIPAGTRLALSSPAAAHVLTNATNEDMLESMEALYKGTRATVMDIHRQRDQRSKWSNPFEYNPWMPHLPKGDLEPPGQGASAGGDISDVEKLLHEYKQVSAAGWFLHMAHNAWSAFGGYLAPEFHGELEAKHGTAYADMHYIKDVSRMPNQKPISNALRDYAYGGAAPQPEPEPEPTLAESWGPDEFVQPNSEIVSSDGRFVLAYQSEGNGCLYDLTRPAGDRLVKELWPTAQSIGLSPSYAHMQPDGNFVVYGKDAAARDKDYWSTQSHGDGATFVVQNDRQVVVYDKDGRALWDAGTVL